MKIKSVNFARVSTREQAEEGYSLPAQEKLLKDHSDKNGFAIIKKFSVPESASGKQERKLFNELLDYIYKHPEIKIVVCEKVDRITRNFKDAVKLDDWLNEDEARQIHFVKQNLVIHKNARSHEKFQWDIYLALARQYSNNLSEETRKGLDEKAAQGWFPGNHKRGYRSIGDAGHKIWVQDDTPQSELKFIKLAFEWYDSCNYTTMNLGKALFKEGWISSTGKPISKSEIHKLLKDPFYCGKFIWHDKIYPGKHTAIISAELFDRVQERIQRKYKDGKYVKHKFLFGNGLMGCQNCEKAFTWEVQKGHHYGHCTAHGNKCTQKRYIKESEVETKVLGVLDGLIIEDPEVLEWVRLALKESHSDEIDYHASVMSDLDNKRKHLEKKLDKLYEDRIDEKISKDFYERNAQKSETELNDVIEAIEKHTKANIDYKKLGINIFELSQRGREIYENKALMEEKRELLNFVFSNIQVNGDQLIPTLHNGFEIVASRAKSGDWLRDMDSNHDRQIQSLSSCR